MLPHTATKSIFAAVKPHLRGMPLFPDAQSHCQDPAAVVEHDPFTHPYTPPRLCRSGQFTSRIPIDLQPCLKGSAE